MTQPMTVPKEKIADLCRRYRVQRIHLFGSALRDDFGPDSDVDVLVEFAPEAQIGFVALSRMQRELSDLFQRPVDLVPRDGLKPAIREAVLSSAEVIYAA
jgi:predicted nucleotidyltransferase